MAESRNAELLQNSYLMCLELHYNSDLQLFLGIVHNSSMDSGLCVWQGGQTIPGKLADLITSLREGEGGGGTGINNITNI